MRRQRDVRRWQLGHMQLDQYAEKHNRFAAAMHKVDPTLTSSDPAISHDSDGRRDGPERGWSEGMLEECADNMDFISEHFYVRTPSDDVPKHVAPNRRRNSQQSRRPSQAASQPAEPQGTHHAHRDGRMELLARALRIRRELGCVYRLPTHSASPPACTNTFATATSSTWPTMRKPST